MAKQRYFPISYPPTVQQTMLEVQRLASILAQIVVMSHAWNVGLEREDVGLTQCSHHDCSLFVRAGGDVHQPNLELNRIL